jgi:hypothetical protein
MALNVEQITSRLAQMPDAALQKYAAMNKNDPYIMALAVSESNRRKEMRQAAQGAQGMMPQPKVADQAVQGMAPAAPMGPAQPMPEDMGIGRLPAGDMNFADGGIVAFADGGEVEHYFEGGFFGDWAAAERKRRQKQMEEERAQNMALVNADAGYAGRGLGILADERVGAPGVVAPSLPAAPTAPAPDQGKAPPVTDLAPRAPRAPGAAPAAGGFKSLLDQINAPATASADVNPYAKEFRELGEARVAAKKEQAEGLEAIQKQYADIFKGREERLTKREGELGKMKDQSLGLALLQAGAAMMTTPGNLGMALGKGVDVGSKQYVAGMDKVNAAKERLSDARDRLEELQAQRGEMSARELLKAKTDIKAEEAGAKELLIKANMDFYKISREEAMKRLQLQTQVGIAQLETGSRERIAAMPGAQERLFSTLGGGDVGKGFERYIAATGPDAKGEAALVAQFAKDPVALQMLEQTNPQLAALVKMRMSAMLMPGVQTTPGAGGARP